MAGEPHERVEEEEGSCDRGGGQDGGIGVPKVGDLMKGEVMQFFVVESCAEIIGKEDSIVEEPDRDGAEDSGSGEEEAGGFQPEGALRYLERFEHARVCDREGAPGPGADSKQCDQGADQQETGSAREQDHQPLTRRPGKCLVQSISRRGGLVGDEPGMIR